MCMKTEVFGPAKGCLVKRSCTYGDCLDGCPQKQKQHNMVQVVNIASWAPITVICRHQTSSDEENNVNDPPDTKPTERQQFPNSCGHVAHAEAIHSKESQKDGKY